MPMSLKATHSAISVERVYIKRAYIKALVLLPTAEERLQNYLFNKPSIFRGILADIDERSLLRGST